MPRPDGCRQISHAIARGYVLTGDDVGEGQALGRESRDPYLLETSVPGIFACGDVRLSPVKRVAAAVGEGSMAIAFVHQSTHALDDLDQLVQAVALVASELHEVPRSLHDRAPFGRPRNRDATTTPELEQSFVPKEPQRTQHGVLVHPEDGGEILRRREPFARLRLTVGNRSPDLAATCS